MAITIIKPAADPGVSAPDIVWDGQRGDFAIVSQQGQGPAGGLRCGEAIATAVLIQYFTDRPVEPSELRFEHRGDRRGWVGDGFDIDATRGETVMGSRLWLYRRSALTAETARSVEDAAREALKPLLDQQLAVRADVQAEVMGETGPNTLRLDTKLFGRDGSLVHAIRFDDLWSFFDGVSAPLAP